MPQPQTAKAIEGVAPEDWPAYGRTQGGDRSFSTRPKSIATTCKDLEVAWTFRTGELPTENDSGETTNQVTPIKVGNNTFMCTTHQRLIALDPGQVKKNGHLILNLKRIIPINI